MPCGRGCATTCDGGTGSGSARARGKRGGVEAGALLLTHGAGGSRESHSLVALEAGLAPLAVERIDFPYRQAGRRAPDRAPKLTASIVEATEALAQRAGVNPAEIVLGGRSLGGRMCSMAVAEGLPAAGLLLLSYPLHPPGKPDNLRIDHFPNIDVPCLFVSGTRDPFGAPEELERETAAIPGPVTYHWLENQAHDPKGCDDEIVTAVTDWLAL